MASKSSFSLDDIRAAADAKYGATEVAGVELRNTIRLSDEERKELSAAYDSLSGLDAEDGAEVTKSAIFDKLAKIIITLAADKNAAEGLVNSIDGELDLIQEVLDRWSEDQKGPKASSSQD